MNGYEEWWEPLDGSYPPDVEEFTPWHRATLQFLTDYNEVVAEVPARFEPAQGGKMVCTYTLTDQMLAHSRIDKARVVDRKGNLLTTTIGTLYSPQLFSYVFTAEIAVTQ